VLRPTTYVVGKQARDATQPAYSFFPSKVMELVGCGKMVTIMGNGARLRCANGLRYGTFDASSGQPIYRPMPNYTAADLATPYAAMIKIENCTGGIDISDLELDGNVSRLLIGGSFGDTGRQIQAYGLQLINNNCSERV